MKTLRAPGLLPYAAMVLWLLHVMLTPASAEMATISRLSDHLDQFHAALMEKGVSPDAKLTLATPDAAIAVAPDETLTIEGVAINVATGRFLIRARGGAGTSLIVVTGVATTPVTLPVLARAIDRNEAIGEEDIDWIDLTDARAGAYVDDAAVLIGKVARRPLPAGQPLRKADILSPVLVKRGETATIILDAPGIRLTQTAVALASGGAGDVITFRNVNSDRDVKAVVASKGIARAPFRSTQTLALLEP